MIGGELATNRLNPYGFYMSNVELTAKLETHGLRATRPRISVARLLFGDGVDRHITAEWVADRLKETGKNVALATVYNTLHNFAEAGLIREVQGGDRGAIVFDTNATPHHHFYNETTKTLTDIPASQVEILGLPNPPDGAEVVGWELVVRVR